MKNCPCLLVGDVSKPVERSSHSACQAGTSQQDQPRPAVVRQDWHRECIGYFDIFTLRCDWAVLIGHRTGVYTARMSETIRIVGVAVARH